MRKSCEEGFFCQLGTGTETGRLVRLRISGPRTVVVEADKAYKRTKGCPRPFVKAQGLHLNNQGSHAQGILLFLFQASPRWTSARHFLFSQEEASLSCLTLYIASARFLFCQ